MGTACGLDSGLRMHRHCALFTRWTVPLVNLRRATRWYNIGLDFFGQAMERGFCNGSGRRSGLSFRIESRKIKAGATVAGFRVVSAIPSHRARTGTDSHQYNR